MRLLRLRHARTAHGHSVHAPQHLEGKAHGCSSSDMVILRWLPGCLRPFLASLLVRLTVPVASSDVRSCPCTQGCCPPDWYQYRDSCYYPVMTTKTWEKAETECKDLVEGAHLASVHSAEENNFIYYLMGTPNNDKKKEGYWLPSATALPPDLMSHLQPLVQLRGTSLSTAFLKHGPSSLRNWHQSV
nr:asialoglycoprotein receptor 1-like [Pelodiscus sinensis]|eukprot:XP_025043798.1 asialoglycoprotein receptor 1-like [Pelodiscus sinensis]